MNKLFILLFSASIFSFTISKAQTYSLGVDSVTEVGSWSDAQFDTSYIIQVTNFLTNNNTTDTVPSNWIRQNYLPTNWTTSVCDPQNCWSESDNTQDFNFYAGVTAPVVVDFKPHQTPGVGISKVTFRKQGDNFDNAMGTFIGTLDAGSGVAKTELLKEIKIYPVPADKKVVVVAPNSLQIKKVEVFNMLGQLQTVSSSIKMDNDVIELDVHALNAGAYFIKVETADGKSVVRKFSKS